MPVPAGVSSVGGEFLLPRVCVALVGCDPVNATPLDQCDAHGLPPTEDTPAGIPD